MIDKTALAARISGCYVPIPTLFQDGDLELNLPGMRRHVEFLLDGGVREGRAAILVCGGAGEFGTLSVDERLRCAAEVRKAVDGKVGVILGVQTTNQRDLIELVQGAERLGCLAVQASAPFYELPTEEDVIEWLRVIADHADVGIVFYATPWTGFHSSLEFVARLVEARNVVAIKWYSPDRYLFERAMRDYSKRIMFIDNSLQYVFSHALGARGINLHVSNYWPQWGQRLWELLEAERYGEAQREMTRVVQPFYDLSREISKYTGGEGHIDKLCLEYVGLDGGRCRPPTRDVRSLFGAKVWQMAEQCGVPRIAGERSKPAPAHFS
jgi:4-hydroxy-tetrahydrodipicolinate synthase